MFTIGFEKKNDNLRWYFHRKINRWDAARNLFLAYQRQDVLREKERVKRAYQKRNTFYWLERGKQESARKVMWISIKEAEPVVTDTEHTCMNEANLKNVSDLVALLAEKTGRTVNRRTREQGIIVALLNCQLRSE